MVRYRRVQIKPERKNKIPARLSSPMATYPNIFEHDSIFLCEIEIKTARPANVVPDMISVKIQYMEL